MLKEITKAKNINIETQITFTDLPLDKTFFQPVQNHLFKPRCGLWSSTLIHKWDYLSHWHWFSDKVWKKTKKVRTLFEFKSNTRIYEIDSYKDLEKLYSREPYNPFDLKSITFIDYERLACDIDVIHLTFKGQYETAHSSPLNLWSWDVESCLIMNYDSIKIIEELNGDA